MKTTQPYWLVLAVMKGTWYSFKRTACTLTSINVLPLVQQMQSIVCSQVNPAISSTFPIDACWDGTGAAENTVYDAMLSTTQHDEYVDDEQHSPEESIVDEVLKTAEQEVPTAPEWDDDAGSNFQTHGELCEMVNGPIQCTVTEPEHTTSTAVTALAVIGGFSLMTVVSIVIALY